MYAGTAAELAAACTRNTVQGWGVPVVTKLQLLSSTNATVPVCASQYTNILAIGGTLCAPRITHTLAGTVCLLLQNQPWY